MKVYAVCGGNRADLILADHDEAAEALAERQAGDPDDFGAWRVEERTMAPEAFAALPRLDEA